MLRDFWDDRSATYERVNRFAQTDLPIMILGPTGSGKSTLAHEIHYISPRSNAIFHAHGCAEFGEDTFASELFGYKKGAYTDAK